MIKQRSVTDLILRDVDPEQYGAAIAAKVVEELKPLLTDSLIRPKSREEMAAWLGIGVATLDRMAKDNRIPSSMLNRRRVFIPERVIAALADEEGQSKQ